MKIPLIKRKPVDKDEDLEKVDGGKLAARLAEIEANGGHVETMSRKRGSAVWSLSIFWPKDS
jgi:hypothetical protein